MIWFVHHKQSLKIRQNKGLKDRLSLNAGQKYCRMLPDFRLMQVKSIAECPSWDILQFILICIKQ